MWDLGLVVHSTFRAVNILRTSSKLIVTMAKRKFTAKEVLDEIMADTDSELDPFSSDNEEVSKKK